jgi:hypothetical protein
MHSQGDAAQSRAVCQFLVPRTSTPRCFSSAQTADKRTRCRAVLSSESASSSSNCSVESDATSVAWSVVFTICICDLGQGCDVCEPRGALAPHPVALALLLHALSVFAAFPPFVVTGICEIPFLDLRALPVLFLLCKHSLFDFWLMITGACSRLYFRFLVTLAVIFEVLSPVLLIMIFSVRGFSRFNFGFLEPLAVLLALPRSQAGSAPFALPA